MNKLWGQWFLFSLLAVGACLAVVSADERIGANSRRGATPSEIGHISETGQIINNKLADTGADVASTLDENGENEPDIISNLRDDADDSVRLDQSAALDPAGPDSLDKDTTRSDLSARIFRSAPVRFIRNLAQADKDSLKQPGSVETLSNRLGKAWERWTGKEQLRDAVASVQVSGDLSRPDNSATTAGRQLRAASHEDSSQTDRGPPAVTPGNGSADTDAPEKASQGSSGWIPKALFGLKAAAAFSADFSSHWILGKTLIHVFSMDPLVGMPLVVMFSTGAFVVSNILSFVMVRPQLYKFFTGQRATMITLSIGAAASFCLAFTAGYHGHLFWAYQNLYGGIAFSTVAALQWFKPEAIHPDKIRAEDRISAIINQSWISALIALAAYIPFFLGQQGVPGLSALSLGSSFIAGIQICASLGFSYLFFPEWFQLRFRRLFRKPGNEDQASEKGASGLFVRLFMWGSMGIGLWAAHRAVNLLAASSVWSAATLLGFHLIQPVTVVAGFLAATAGLGLLLMRRLTYANWDRLLEAKDKIGLSPGVLGLGLSFVALAGLMLALIPIGHATFATFLTLPTIPENVSELGMLTVYLIENTLAVIVSFYMLDAIRNYRTHATSPSADISQESEEESRSGRVR